MKNFELTEDNLFIFAAKYYYNPLGVDADEFKEDLMRFKYVKRLINKYLETDNLNERLILNHLIVILNVFGPECSLKVFEMRLNKTHWCVLKPFLIFLRAIENTQYTNITQDPIVVDQLRKIAK